jgi:hypothetical protein
MFSRSIISKFNQWAGQRDRKPLVLRGARQVGKTTAVDLWADQFDQYLYLNLELAEDKALFERKVGFEERVESIFFYKGAVRDGGKTLLFIDEIQNSPQAVAELRYFYEKAGRVFVIAAGSLLESLINRHISFPVGRVEYHVMRPLSFREFLEADDEPQAIRILDQIPMPSYAHDKLLRLFHRFAFIGGMPEIVKVYLDTRDLNRLKPIYESLLVSYLDDVEKYAATKAQSAVLRHIIRNAFLEAGSRITFQGFGKSNYRSREMSEAFAILEKAMLLNLIYPTTHTQPPALPNRKRSPKLQLLDTGLVNYFAGLQKDLFQSSDLHHVYKGKIAEHIVGQELLAENTSVLHGLHFWVREKKQSNAEVDFILPFGDYLIPIEVKSGAAGRLRSLHQFIDQAPHPYAVRFYSDEVFIDTVKTTAGKPFFLLNMPYYLIGKLDDYLAWFLSEVKKS